MQHEASRFVLATPARLRACVRDDRLLGYGLGAAFFGGGGFRAPLFPRDAWGGRRGLVAVFDAVVLIGLAHRAQRFVVQAGQAEGFFQFFGELLQGFEVVGGGGDFGLGGFQKLLVAAVDQLGDFAADQVAGIGKDLDAVVAIFLDGGGDSCIS